MNPPLPNTVWEPHWLPDRDDRLRCQICDKIVVGMTIVEAQSRADRIHDRSGRKMYPYIGKKCGYFHLTRKLKKSRRATVDA